MASIENDTPLLPVVVADAVVREVEQFGGELANRDSLVTILADKAETIYQNNPRFRRRIRAVYGREYLYAFMRHWLTGELSGYVNGKKLPESFAVGGAL